MAELEQAIDEDDPQRPDWFVTAATAIGDLDSPFYEEERQRDVWNEACTVGFQAMLWLCLAAPAAMIWIAGAPAMPYVLSLLGIATIGSAFAVGYAARMGVNAEDPKRLTLARMMLGLLLVGATVAGLIYHAAPSGFGNGVAWGAGAGMVLALLGLAWQWRRKPDEDPATSAP